MEKKLWEVFMKKNCRKLIGNNLELKMRLKVRQYFPPYRSSGGDIKVELDLSSYATKKHLKKCDTCGCQ